MHSILICLFQWLCILVFSAVIGSLNHTLCCLTSCIFCNVLLASCIFYVLLGASLTDQFSSCPESSSRHGRFPRASMFHSELSRDRDRTDTSIHELGDYGHRNGDIASSCE